jgi:hypothetical protein
MDGRRLLGAGQQRVHVPVARRAARHVERAVGQVLSVNAARVLLGHNVVAYRAIDPAEVVGMGQIVGPTVAVGALEEAVHGFCEGFRIGVVAVGTRLLGRRGRGENGRGEQQQRARQPRNRGVRARNPSRTERGRGADHEGDSPLAPRASPLRPRRGLLTATPSESRHPLCKLYAVHRFVSLVDPQGRERCMTEQRRMNHREGFVNLARLERGQPSGG